MEIVSFDGSHRVEASASLVPWGRNGHHGLCEPQRPIIVRLPIVTSVLGTAYCYFHVR